MRILIAEDDLVLADGLLRTLRASGAVADHVASGSEADAAWFSVASGSGTSLVKLGAIDNLSLVGNASGWLDSGWRSFTWTASQAGTLTIGLAVTDPRNIAAKAEAYLATTGIADIAMVQPTDKTIVSVQASYAPTFGMSSTSIDISTPLVGDTLGFAGGYNNMIVRGDGKTAGRIQTEAFMFRWRPVKNFEVLPFFYRNHVFKTEVAPQIV